MLLLALCLPMLAGSVQAQPNAGVREAAVASTGSPEESSKKPDEAGPSPEYDQLVLSALAAFEAGEWARARSRFEQAHALHPTARTLRTIGMAAFNQGDLVGAVQHLEASLSDDRKPLTLAQQRHVRQLLEQAYARLGRLRLLVSPPEAQILVDGKAPAFVGDQLLLEPGRHEIRVQAPGHLTRRQTVRVSARDRATLEIQLTPDADDPAARSGAPTTVARANPNAPRASQSAPSASQTAQPAPARGGMPTGAWVAYGIGAAGLVTAGVAGGLAMAQQGELDDHEACMDRACGPAAHADVDRYERFRWATLAGLGVAAVGGIVGTALWALAPDDESPALTARVGIGFVEVRGKL